MKKIGLKDWEVYNEPRVAVYFVCKQPACSNFAFRTVHAQRVRDSPFKQLRFEVTLQIQWRVEMPQA